MPPFFPENGWLVGNFDDANVRLLNMQNVQSLYSILIILRLIKSSIYNVQNI